MGYDIYLVQTPLECRAAWKALQAAQADLSNAISAQLDNRVNALLNVQDLQVILGIGSALEDPHYFGANLGIMAGLEERMLECGMLITEGSAPSGPPIESATPGMTSDEWERTFGYLSFHPPEAVGIPWWKLSSNDGWHVTAEECRQAIEAWAECNERRDDPFMEGPDYWADWLRYLALAASTDGFDVY